MFGGILDDEFARISRAFFTAVRKGRLALVTSALVAEELEAAPPYVWAWFRRHVRLAEVAEISPAALSLRQAYLSEGIVTPKSATDALHVAIATVYRCPVLVSWNCRHIVNYRRIPRYNEVNRINGYGELAIHTPLEVVGDESE